MKSLKFMVARNSGGSACSADADVKAKTPIWRVPDEFTFQVDEETLLAEAVEFVFPESSNEKEEDELQVKIKEAFRSNHPKCIHCGELARPSVLMFGDGDWVEDRQGEDNYQRWEANMRHQCKKNDKKLVILEIGCGTNVATVRYHSNGFFPSL